MAANDREKVYEERLARCEYKRELAETRLAEANEECAKAGIGKYKADYYLGNPTLTGRIEQLEVDAQSIKTIGDLLKPFGWSDLQSRPISSYVRDVITNLATVTERIAALEGDIDEAKAGYTRVIIKRQQEGHILNERIETLEHDLAVNKNAYSTWYKRCLEAHDRIAQLENALRPFADFWKAAVEEHPDLFDVSDEELDDPYLLVHKQAAALLGDGEEDGDEKAE